MEKIKRTILQAVTTGTTQGYWNANSNIPDISIIAGIGNMWYVSVSGKTVLGDIDTWNVGDWVVSYDGGWGKMIIKTYNYTGSTGNTVAIPDFSVNYYAKIGLKQVARDLGFFDAYIEYVPPIPPTPPPEPTITFYLEDDNGDILGDNYNNEYIFNTYT